HMRYTLHALAGVLVVLSLCAAPLAMAEEHETFTNASLDGSYAYVNNTGGVASFGPILFDGQGGLTLTEIVNLPCDTDTPTFDCPRTIVNLTGDGTYTVNPDGTGVAVITFQNNGTVITTGTFDFVISETIKKRGQLLATKVFAAEQAGGLAGQLVAPT